MAMEGVAGVFSMEMGDEKEKKREGDGGLEGGPSLLQAMLLLRPSTFTGRHRGLVQKTETLRHGRCTGSMRRRLTGQHAWPAAAGPHVKEVLNQGPAPRSSSHGDGGGVPQAAARRAGGGALVAGGAAAEPRRYVTAMRPAVVPCPPHAHTIQVASVRVPWPCLEIEFRGKEASPNPKYTANPLSRLLWSWLDAFVVRGYKHELENADFFTLEYADSLGPFLRPRPCPCSRPHCMLDPPCPCRMSCVHSKDMHTKAMADAVTREWREEQKKSKVKQHILNVLVRRSHMHMCKPRTYIHQLTHARHAAGSSCACASGASLAGSTCALASLAFSRARGASARPSSCSTCSSPTPTPPPVTLRSAPRAAANLADAVPHDGHPLWPSAAAYLSPP